MANKTLNCKVEKGIPICPQCKGPYNKKVKDYGVMENGTFWFSFSCETCSSKKGKVTIRYETDENFKVKG